MRYRSVTAVALIGFSMTALCLCVHAQPRPLQTDDPALVRPGHIRFQTGFEFLQNQTFQLSGLKGDLSRIGVIGVFVGAGRNVEFQVTGTLLNSLSIDRRFPPALPNIDVNGNSTNSVGDFTLGAKFRLLGESESVPALAFRFAVELPNAGTEKGLGNDETNFKADFLLGKSFGKFRSFANLGLAILGDPTSMNSQDDLFTYGWAATYAVNDQWTLVAEVNGRTGPGGPGTDDQSQLRFGAQIKTGRMRWDLAGLAGLTSDDADSGIIFGVSYDFLAFRFP